MQARSRSQPLRKTILSSKREAWAASTGPGEADSAEAPPSIAKPQGEVTPKGAAIAESRIVVSPHEVRHEVAEVRSDGADLREHQDGTNPTSSPSGGATQPLA